MSSRRAACRASRGGRARRRARRRGRRSTRRRRARRRPSSATRCEHLLEVERRVDGGDRLGQQPQMALGRLHGPIVGARGRDERPALLPPARRVLLLRGSRGRRDAAARGDPAGAAERGPRAAAADAGRRGARRRRRAAHARLRDRARRARGLRLLAGVDPGRARALGRRAWRSAATAGGRPGTRATSRSGSRRRATRRARSCTRSSPRAARCGRATRASLLLLAILVLMVWQPA